MRTTLDIDDDVLMAAKEFARRRGTTAGRVLSDLARAALAGATDAGNSAADRALVALGFTPFPSRGAVITNDMVNRIREELGE